ncbi:putative dynamin family protein [Neofusicoccum parvum UCRNP2]|uniref:Putative dynamin family protein n=1 Tax=Botryosphaeria parva (strain UCR-NP2) TaxID=1287680 RepID=R1EPU2_BOTPV|nr:putative dynamin family protein [Neofusicoccum parvum UCRNP2]
MFEDSPDNLAAEFEKVQLEEPAKEPMVAQIEDLQALGQLQNSDQTSLLDAIDELRAHGISKHINLPQLIVCGDQSSGKSSLLEAITHLPFPTKDGICTTFATEVALRRSPGSSVKITITPGASRSDADAARLRRFTATFTNAADFPALIDSAKQCMNPSDPEHDKSISDDVLHLDISGPAWPPLTIVDLPGLIQTETRGQTAADKRTVRALVRSYMQNPRSVVLAVVSAINDFANQGILSLAREVDPHGTRTLGIITKPDRVVVGSGDEAVAQIRRELPVLIEEIRKGIADCKDDLDRLGEPRVTPKDHRAYLVSISKAFERMTLEAVNGLYQNSFFTEPEEESQERRLRAVIQNSNDEFARVMRAYGHLREITDRKAAESGARRKYGSSSSSLENAAPDPEVMTRIRKQLLDKIDELLKPYQSNCLITYHPQFVEYRDQIRKKPLQDGILQNLALRYGTSTVETTLEDLARVIASTETDTADEFASVELYYCMEAFYKVALNNFIDNTATLAVESCLVSSLEEIFSPSVVALMDDDTLANLASETDDVKRLPY